MREILHNPEFYLEQELFSQGARAGEFIFLAQDGRNSSGGLDPTIELQTRRAIENLAALLESFHLSLRHLISLAVFLPRYADAPVIAAILRDHFADESALPAVIFVGVGELDGNCQVRIDAIATDHRDRETIRIADLPLSPGAECHGVRVGNWIFLSGVDAADRSGKIGTPETIQTQTREVLTRLERILGQQRLGLGTLCRTFMFIPGTQYRPGYGEARKEVYRGVFTEDEFPPNSGIYIRSLGENILLRSSAIAFRGDFRIVTSDRVRKAPGSFSQSVRAGDWLLLAGQDAVGFNREVLAEGSLAGQTEVTLQHTRHIVEAAGGTLDDIVKITVYLTEGTDRAEFAAAYRKFFRDHGRSHTMPAGLTLTVRELSPRCMVEIDSVAYLGRGR